jgi:two-component sensor histidine kinase
MSRFSNLAYGCAILTIALALLARMLLIPYIGAQFPFATVYLAVIITAWYGGLRPAVLATVLGYLGVAYFVIPPYHTLILHGLSDYIGAGIYLFISLTSALFSEAQHRAQARAETSAMEARRQTAIARESESRANAVITARKEIEAQQQFLAEASDLFASSLDYQTTLQSVARLAVPRLADWCVVHLLNDAGTLELMAVAHVDPAKVEVARESSRRYPPRKDEPGGLAAVARTGKPEWLEEISGDAIRATAQDEEHYRMLSTSGMKSYLCVPLLARGTPLGTITLVGGESGHRYTAESLPLAEELARRAGIAVDNARLYAAAQRELEERQRVESELADMNARLRRSVQETHHRVKNNLQIISALAELQAEDGNGAIPVTAVRRIGQHARTLAAIHDLLTRETRGDAQADSIATRAAMNKLIPLLQATTGGRSIKYSVDDFRLPVREGASLALLVSELVSNAVKHGQGDIDLTLSVNEDLACLEVCDDGPGFPSGFDWQKEANTGLGLIDSTGRYDLRGTIAFQNRPEGGAQVQVTFPLPALDSG